MRVRHRVSVFGLSKVGEMRGAKSLSGGWRGCWLWSACRAVPSAGAGSSLGISGGRAPPPFPPAPPSSPAHLSLLVMGPALPSRPLCRGSPGTPRCIEPPGQRLERLP